MLVGFLCKHPMLSNTHITMLFKYFLGVSREPRGVSRRSMRLSTSLQDVPQASKGFHERSMTLHDVHTEPHKALGASRRLVEEPRGASWSLVEPSGSCWKLVETPGASAGSSWSLEDTRGTSWSLVDTETYAKSNVICVCWSIGCFTSTLHLPEKY